LTGLDKWTADLRAASTDPAKAKTLFEGEGPVAVNQLAAKAGVDGCEPKE
jgi:hypothetical protein